MCYATKRKIADCVKHLMKKKEIRKITIQDIMDATNMSRQSFFYDVLEWIERNDFAERIICEPDQTLEEWTLHLFHVLDEERPFLERVVNEVEWPKLLSVISAPIQEQMRSILVRYDRVGTCEADLDFCVKFATNAYCYILMDYVYRRKHKTGQQLREEVHSFLAMMDTKPMFHSLDGAPVESRLVG